MSDIFVRSDVSNQEYVQLILPGFEERAEEGAVVIVTPKSVRVDNSRKKPYTKDLRGAGEGEAKKSP